MKTLSIKTQALQEVLSRSRGDSTAARNFVKTDSQRDPGDHSEQELEDLRKELERFCTERERVRAIVGKIGAIPKTRGKILNMAFIAVIAVTLVVSIIGGEAWRLLMIEIATVTLALKIIYLIHSQMRVAHFEFWMLSSIEWRVNEVTRQLRELRRAGQV